MAAALAAIEKSPYDEGTISLLDETWHSARGHVLGLTGPPGVGKSTLINNLIRLWRGQGKTVGVIAVDPSSKRSGGALLGDRTRLNTDPGDKGVFVRSMAAREKLGGLAALTVPAVSLMRALYDIVLVETVGVGQSETDVSYVADSVIFCVQPGSGDSLQFMKAGIMEVPDIIVVTKGDMGATAGRAQADVIGALGLSTVTSAKMSGQPDKMKSGYDVNDQWSPPVLIVAATKGQGIDELADAVGQHWQWLNRTSRLTESRQAQGQRWLVDACREEFGRHGLAIAGDKLKLPSGRAPFGEAVKLRQTIYQHIGD